MLLAIPYANNELYQHFGNTPEFKLYHIEDAKITSTELLPTHGQSHVQLIGILLDAHVTALAAGEIGSLAICLLNDQDVNVYSGLHGNADDIAQTIAAAGLQPNNEPTHQCGCHHS